MSKITKYFPYIASIKSLLSQDSSICSNKDVEFFNVSYLKSFLHFIEKNNTIQKFLEADKCKLLADKYLIALTFAYFVRARIPVTHFDTHTFFAALHIAHDMEEDDLLLKRNLCNWTSCSWEDDQKFYEKRRQFLEMMNFRAVVSQEMCDKIMNMEETKGNLLWKRERSFSHAGALNKRHRGYDTCNYCKEDKIQDRIRRYYQPFGDGYLTLSESGSSYDDEDESSCDCIQAESLGNNEATTVNEINQDKQEKLSVNKDPDVNIVSNCSPIIPDYSESPLFPDYSVRISTVNKTSSEKPLQPVPTVIPADSCTEIEIHPSYVMLANESCSIITPVNESSEITSLADEKCNITKGGHEKDSITTGPNEKCKITTGTNKTCANTNLCHIMINTPEIDDHITVIDQVSTKNSTELDFLLDNGLEFTSKEKNTSKISQDNMKSINHMLEHDKKKSFEEMLIEMEKSLEKMDTKKKQLTELFKTKQSPDLIFSNAICTKRITASKEKENTHYNEQVVANEFDKNTVRKDVPNDNQETRVPIGLMDRNIIKPVVNENLLVKESSKKNDINKMQGNRKTTVPKKQLPSWKGLHRKVDNILEDFDKSGIQESTPITFGQTMEDYVKLKTDLPLDHCKHQMIEHYKTQNPKLRIKYSKIQLGRILNYEFNTGKMNVKSPNLNLKGNVSKHTLKPESLENKNLNKKGKFPTTNSMYQKNQLCLEHESKKLVKDNSSKEDINDEESTLLDSLQKCYKSKFLTPNRSKTSSKSKSVNKLKDVINKIKKSTQKNIIQQNVKNTTQSENVIAIARKEISPVCLLEEVGRGATSTSCNADPMVQSSNEPSKLLDLSINKNINFTTKERLKTKIQTETTSGSSSVVKHEKSIKILKIQKSITNITHQTKQTNIETNHSKVKKFMKPMDKYQNKSIQNHHSNGEVEFMKFPALSKANRMKLIPLSLPSLEEMKQEQTRILERMRKKFGIQALAFQGKETDAKKTDKISNNCSLEKDKGRLTNKDENNNQFENFNLGLDENNNESKNQFVTTRHVSVNADTQHDGKDDSMITDDELVKSKIIIPINEKYKCNTKEASITSVEKDLTKAQIHFSAKNKMFESKVIATVIRDVIGNYQCNTKGINSHCTLAESEPKSTIDRDVLSNNHDITLEKIIESTEKSIRKAQELEICSNTDNMVDFKSNKTTIRNNHENYQFNIEEQNNNDLNSKSTSKPKGHETLTSEPKSSEVVLFDMTDTAIAPLRGLVQSISEMTNQIKILGNKIEAIERHIPKKRKAQPEDLNPRKIARYEKAADQFSGYQNIGINENNQDDDIIIIKENIVTRYNVQMIRCSNTDQLSDTSFPTCMTDKPIKTEKISENLRSEKGKVEEVKLLDVSQTLRKQLGLMEHTTSKFGHQARKNYFNTTRISISIQENPDTKEKYLNLKIGKTKKK